MLIENNALPFFEFSSFGALIFVSSVSKSERARSVRLWNYVFSVDEFCVLFSCLDLFLNYGYSCLYFD